MFSFGISKLDYVLISSSLKKPLVRILASDVTLSLVSADQKSPFTVGGDTASDLGGSSPNHLSVMGSVFPVSSGGSIGELFARDIMSLFVDP